MTIDCKAVRRFAVGIVASLALPAHAHPQQMPAGSCYRLAAGEWHGSIQLKSTDNQVNPTSDILGVPAICPEDQAERLAEEDAVILAVIDSMYRRETGLLLLDTTRSSFAGPQQNAALRGAIADTLLARDYRAINNEKRSLRGLKPAHVSFQVTETDGVGRISVSRVGFNPDRTTAVMDAFYVRGGRCGYGGLFILKKANGVWRIVANPIISVS